MCGRCDFYSKREDALIIETKFSRIPHRLIVQEMGEVLRGVEFDTLVGIGMSGTLVVPSIAKITGKYGMALRKEVDNANRWEPRFGVGTLGKKWIFFDEWATTGQTRKEAQRMITKLCEAQNFTTEYVGTYQYGKQLYTTAECEEFNPVEELMSQFFGL